MYVIYCVVIHLKWCLHNMQLLVMHVYSCFCRHEMFAKCNEDLRHEWSILTCDKLVDFGGEKKCEKPNKAFES